jgi:hypothetical protein
VALADVGDGRGEGRRVVPRQLGVNHQHVGLPAPRGCTRPT